MSIGISKEEVYRSTPNDLKPYVLAHNLVIEQQDEMLWREGYYNMFAVATAISKSLSKKSDAKYIEKPLLQIAKEKRDEENITEDEAKRQRNNLLAMLQLMQANFEMNDQKS